VTVQQAVYLLEYLVGMAYSQTSGRPSSCFDGEPCGVVVRECTTGQLRLTKESDRFPRRNQQGIPVYEGNTRDYVDTINPPYGSSKFPEIPTEQRTQVDLCTQAQQLTAVFQQRAELVNVPALKQLYLYLAAVYSTESPYIRAACVLFDNLVRYREADFWYEDTDYRFVSYDLLLRTVIAIPDDNDNEDNEYSLLTRCRVKVNVNICDIENVLDAAVNNEQKLNELLAIEKPCDIQDGLDVTTGNVTRSMDALSLKSTWL